MAKIKLPKAKPTGLQHIELVLKARLIPFETEFRFMEERKFRFDIAIPSKKIAIEYEGLNVGSNSRHTTNHGYSNDCIKYNHAITYGWKVLRFTSQNYKEVGFFLSILFPEN